MSKEEPRVCPLCDHPFVRASPTGEVWDSELFIQAHLSRCIRDHMVLRLSKFHRQWRRQFFFGTKNTNELRDAVAKFMIDYETLRDLLRQLKP